MKGPARRSLAERIEGKYSPEPISGCWLWTGAVNATGRPVIVKGGRNSGNILAYRVMWEIHNGPIPDGLNACHRCDTPLCVNPNHLFLGTQGDNARDMWTKGRGVRPPRHHRGRHVKGCSMSGCTCYAR